MANGELVGFDSFRLKRQNEYHARRQTINGDKKGTCQQSIERGIMGPSNRVTSGPKPVVAIRYGQSEPSLSPPSDPALSFPRFPFLCARRSKAAPGRAGTVIRQCASVAFPGSRMLALSDPSVATNAES